MKAEKLFNVSGKVAFVTGAASGLGLAMAEVLAENGACVTMADIDGDALEALVRKMREAGSAVEAAVLDVADSDEIKGLALFLASPASSYVTGTVIPIDGGVTAG